MPSPLRRALPDNLDPLVDTLSNVVGILVIVVALTQIQLGDALTRVAELDFLRMREERAHDLLPAEAEVLAARRDALLRRAEADVEESIGVASTMLAALAELGTPARKEGDNQSGSDLQTRLATSREELRETRGALDQRKRIAEHLQRVPKRMVARLPDPQVVQGKESWILVRYGRIYLADREKLFEQGQRAIGRVLGVGDDLPNRRIRPDEYESVAHYLRKRDTGVGSFRWYLNTVPDVRVELAWRSLEAGLEHPDLAASRAISAWLATRSPKLDFIRFHVWGDSFEAYLAAREVIEAAGFRAGWRGHELEDELVLPLRIGPPVPDVGPIDVD